MNFVSASQQGSTLSDQFQSSSCGIESHNGLDDPDEYKITLEEEEMITLRVVVGDSLTEHAVSIRRNIHERCVGVQCMLLHMHTCTISKSRRATS